ncbi:MAG: glycosyltransferase family 2 protein [Gammaproteobacteria bacterium]
MIATLEPEPNIAVTVLRRLGMFFKRQVHELSKKLQRIRCERKHQQQWPPDKPLVTIIIPCYNYGMFVKEAVESVLAQSFQRFEIIVIDDGSTDGLTISTLQNMKYDKMRVVHQANQGLAETRNNGAKLAAGKYICYLDADDSIEPTYLEKTVSTLEMDESLGSCYSWVKCFGEFDSVWKTQDLDPYYLWQYTTAPSHSVIRKEAWEKVREQNGSGFITKYNGYFEDWVFWIDMVQCGYRGKVIPEPFIHYRVHKDSLGATHKTGWGEMLKVLHADRWKFFHSRTYRRNLSKMMSKRIYIENNRINLHHGDHA